VLAQESHRATLRIAKELQVPGKKPPILWILEAGFIVNLQWDPCRNPSLGLATKAKRNCKGAGQRKARELSQEDARELKQEEARESHHILPGV